MEFIKDCLSREMSLKDIEMKWGVTDVLAEYKARKAHYTQKEIDEVMNDVYYKI